MKKNPTQQLAENLQKNILYIVATPIGNLEDITIRALRILQSTPVMIAEDTRTAKRLFAGLKIENKPLFLSHHEHSQEASTNKIIETVLKHGTAVYVSDAGTPIISDPGKRLVMLARKHDITIVPIPGASALTTLLSVSDLEQTLPIHFLGFAPAVKKRQDFFAQMQTLSGVIVIFEAPHRIIATINNLIKALGKDKKIVIGRELTKLHEQIISDTLSNISHYLEIEKIPKRGEFSLCIEAGGCQPSDINAEQLMNALTPYIRAKDAAKITAEATGVSSNDLYKQHLQKKQ